MSRRPTMSEEELIKWFYNQKRVTDSGCWEWTRCINGGYGKVCINGKRMLVHRHSLELHLKRPVPKELEVRHMCHNPICFNPEHLQEGTHYQNMRDMVESNRQSKGEKLSSRLKGIKHVKANGEGNSNSKLTEDQVLEILAHNGVPGSQLYFAKLYGMSRNHIKRIQNGKSWTHLGNNNK